MMWMTSLMPKRISSASYNLIELKEVVRIIFHNNERHKL